MILHKRKNCFFFFFHTLPLFDGEFLKPWPPGNAVERLVQREKLQRGKIICRTAKNSKGVIFNY